MLSFDYDFDATCYRCLPLQTSPLPNESTCSTILLRFAKKGATFDDKLEQNIFKVKPIMFTPRPERYDWRKMLRIQ